jgi:hypothetical protein
VVDECWGSDLGRWFVEGDLRLFENAFLLLILLSHSYWNWTGYKKIGGWNRVEGCACLIQVLIEEANSLIQTISSLSHSHRWQHPNLILSSLGPLKLYFIFTWFLLQKSYWPTRLPVPGFKSRSRPHSLLPLLHERLILFYLQSRHMLILLLNQAFPSLTILSSGGPISCHFEARFGITSCQNFVLFIDLIIPIAHSFRMLLFNYHLFGLRINTFLGLWSFWDID